MKVRELHKGDRFAYHEGAQTLQKLDHRRCQLVDLEGNLVRHYYAITDPDREVFLR